MYYNFGQTLSYNQSIPRSLAQRNFMKELNISEGSGKRSSRTHNKAPST